MSAPTLAQATADFWDNLEYRKKSALTIRAYSYRLGALEDWLNDNDRPLTVSDIESRDIEGFFLHLSRRPKRPGFGYRTKPQGKLSAATLESYYKAISSFFSWAKRKRLLNSHKPMEGVDKPTVYPKEIRVFSYEEVGRLLALVDKPCITKRNLYVAFKLMWRLGLRVGEVSNLRLRDVNFEQGLLFVQGKGKKERKLPIRNGMEKLLTDYIAEWRPQVANGCDRLLVSTTGRPVRPDGIRASFTRYAERAGVVGTPHVLRHTFATDAIRNGVDVFRLQRLLGHSKLETTERYVHANHFDDLCEAIDLVDARRPDNF